MNDKVIDGKKLALEHEVRLKAKIQQLGIRPKIVSILVGQDPASVLYSKIKKNKAWQVGVDFKLHEFPEDTSFQTLESEIEKLNNDRSVNGVMVQLPLPRQRYDDDLTDQVVWLIKPEKDVDGLTNKGPVPQATIRGVLSILDAERIDINGKKVGVVGVTGMIGGPLAEILRQKGAQILGFDSKTVDLNKEAARADILISCVGKPNLIGSDAVKNGAVVIDVGGDVDFDSAWPKASKITPPKGGVGPMTVISLMENVVDLLLIGEYNTDIKGGSKTWD